MPLRRRLFALTAAAIVPLAIMAGAGIYALWSQHSRETELVGLELARSVANAVDAELRSAVAVLDTLSTSPSLDTNDLPAFAERARRVLATRPHWAAIVLADGSGTLLNVSGAVIATPWSTPDDREAFERVVREGSASVGGLFRHASEGWMFAVRVPARRDSETVFVLSAIIRPEAVREVIGRQRLSPDWVISIVDGNGLRVARSRSHEDTVGGRLSPTGQDVLSQGGQEGVGVSTSLEGERIVTPYSRLPSTSWFAVLGIPTASVDAAASRSLAVYGGGLLLSIVLGLGAAAWVARTITRPIADLRASAEAMGRNETPPQPRTSIQEIRAVGGALTTAAHDLARGQLEREELLHNERLAREAAEHADRAKDQFMAVLSHELRTPLNAVYGWARMLQSGQLRDAETTARAKDAIVRNADAQVKLIDDLLDLSRITTGKMRLEPQRVDLHAVLLQAIDAVRPAAEAKLIRVDAHLRPGATHVNGDPTRLQQIVWNLLMNAVKFTPSGGAVTLALHDRDDDVQIVISDTGRGIAPEMLPHVFERFRQADSSSTRTHGGLGLGLALVKHLVELHGGTVAVHSDGRDRGATFTVTLPTARAAIAVEPPARAVASAPDADVKPIAARLDGLRVLVTDDDDESVALAEAILTRAGATVKISRSAAEALPIVIGWRPDVLISDIEMPREDGYSLIRKVRALRPDEGAATPAIALSAYGRPEDRSRSIAAGFTMHVPKPVDPAELTAVIAEAVRTRSGPPEASS